MLNGKTLYVCSFCGQERDEVIENEERICLSCEERKRFFRDLRDLPREILSKIDEIDRKRVETARNLTDEENETIKHLLGYMLAKIKPDLTVLEIWSDMALAFQEQS